jgi:fibronectin type 3 domain-containing protein
VFNPIKSADGLAPTAPSNVAAVAGNATVTITWTAPQTNSDSTILTDLLGYEIYRSTSGGSTYTQLNSSDITTTSYTDSTAVNGQTYYYKVTAADTGGLESSMSSASNAASPAQPATGSGASAVAPAAPTVNTTSVVVSGGTTVKSLNIVLKFNVSNAVQMVISEDPNFVGASWESYVTTKAYTLSAGLGARKLYVKFRSAQGGISDLLTLDLNVVGTSVSEPAPTLGVAPLTVTPAAPSAPAAEVVVSRPESKVVVSNVAAVSLQPGAQLKFTYQYQNETAKKATVRVVRQLVNSKGKIIKSATASRVLRAGATLKVDVKEVVAKTLPPGDYTVKVKILNTRGKVLEENSFGIIVEKPKKKTFVLGEVESLDSPIVFDAKLLAKVKSNVLVPVTLKLKYSYTNTTDKKQMVRMVRELIDENGKIKASGFGKWVMKVGEKDTVKLNQPIASNLAAGSYTLRLRALDWKTKEVLAENGLNFTIELK